MDWTLEDNMVDGLFFCATLTSRRREHTHLCKQEQKRPTPVRRLLSLIHMLFFGGRFRRVGPGVGDESTESCRVVQPPRLPLVMRPERARMLFCLQRNYMENILKSCHGSDFRIYRNCCI